jgi:hypothetical protein
VGRRRAEDGERHDERPARPFVRWLAGQRLEEAGERQQEDGEEDARADQAQRLLVRLGRGVEGVGKRWDGEDRRRQDCERRDDPRARRVEALEPVPEPADGEREPENEDAVREDRADQRGLHKLDQALVEREQGDEELGEVAERRLNGPAPDELRRPPSCSVDIPTVRASPAIANAASANRRTGCQSRKCASAAAATRTASTASSIRSRLLIARRYQPVTWPGNVLVAASLSRPSRRRRSARVAWNA